MIDVAPYQLKIINAILQKHVPDCEVRAFGSRVTWTAKDYSDLDIAIVGKENLPNKIIYAIKDDFQESDLPFRVDVLDWNTISEEFKKVINKQYEVIQKSPIQKKTGFKDTEIGKIPEDWELFKLNEFVDINPKRILTKGTKSKAISMQDLKEFHKKVQNYTYKRYNGGTKFKNGDTLMARITPCLENGKTAFVDILDEKEVGFGSTEFIILSEKEGCSIKDYVYYLAVSPDVRAEAIKSMTGTSGRQRVQTELLKIIKICAPKINEQKSISKILFDLDAKIELNQKMNKTLENIAQIIFKHWFIDFEFPNEEGNPYKSSGGKMQSGIPEGWSPDFLGNYVDVINGCSYSSKDLQRSDKALVTLKSITRGGGFNREGFKEYTGKYKEKQVILDGDIVVAHTDLTQKAEVLGRPAIVWNNKKYKELIASLDLTIVRVKEQMNKPFLYYLLKQRDFQGHAYGYASGTTVLHLSKKAIPEYQFVMPAEKLLNKFGIHCESIFMQIKNNDAEIENLTLNRDLLLPRLMSGKIRVA